jgi:hypothetical protein
MFNQTFDMKFDCLPDDILQLPLRFGSSNAAGKIGNISRPIAFPLFIDDGVFAYHWFSNIANNTRNLFRREIKSTAFNLPTKHWIAKLLIVPAMIIKETA